MSLFLIQSFEGKSEACKVHNILKVCVKENKYTLVGQPWLQNVVTEWKLSYHGKSLRDPLLLIYSIIIIYFPHVMCTLMRLWLLFLWLEAYRKESMTLWLPSLMWGPTTTLLFILPYDERVFDWKEKSTRMVMVSYNFFRSI